MLYARHSTPLIRCKVRGLGGGDIVIVMRGGYGLETTVAVDLTPLTSPGLQLHLRRLRQPPVSCMLIGPARPLIGSHSTLCHVTHDSCVSFNLAPLETHPSCPWLAIACVQVKTSTSDLHVDRTTPSSHWLPLNLVQVQ